MFLFFKCIKSLGIISRYCLLFKSILLNNDIKYGLLNKL